VIINATEVKNSFGKILKLLDYEDVVVKKNGRIVAKIIRYTEDLDQFGTVEESKQVYEPKDRKVTYEEFLKLTANSEKRYEFLDGEIHLLSSPRVKHQTTVGILHGELYKHLNKHKCIPFVAPYDITFKIDNKMNVLQPDLGVICDLEEHTDEEDRYIGLPTLVVEVLSPSSISRDKVRKLNTYMLSGIEEYWIVDPEKESVSVYQFKEYEVENYADYKRIEGIQSFVFKELKLFW